MTRHRAQDSEPLGGYLNAALTEKKGRVASHGRLE
jgi:hypothetical protein